MDENIPHIIDSFRDIKGLDFVSIRDSALSPTEVSDAILRSKRNVHSYRMRNVDWRMLDFIKRVPGVDSSTLKVVQDAVADKTLTRRFYNADATLESLKHFGGADTPDFSWSVNFRVASTILRNELGLRKLEPVKITPETQIDEVFSDKSTSAGAICSGSKEENWDLIKDTALNILKGIDGDVPFDHLFIPAMMFHRAQLKNLVIDSEYNSDYDEKDRLIWGVDAATVTLEAAYARPLIELTKRDWPGYAGGKDPAQLRGLIANAHTANDHWYTTDYSKFDQTVPGWLIHQCFNIVRDFYDDSEKKRIDWIEYNFRNTVILLPDGQAVRVHKGIPSGSHFTQLIGSMANYLMMVTYIASTVTGNFDDKVNSVIPMLRFPYSENHMRMFVMGDDNLFFSGKEFDVHDMAAYVTRVFGVKVNGTKTLHGTNRFPQFLHRKWMKQGEWREPIEMIINLVMPERIRRYDGYTPLEIVFSIFFTFSKAFNAPTHDLMKWFQQQFHDSGSNANALRNLPKSELPGSAKVYSEEARENLVKAVMGTAV